MSTPVGHHIETVPPFIAAAVQAAPVFLDVASTVDLVIDRIDAAAQHGASLIAFPEAFIPGYPYWNWIMSPVQGSVWFERLYRASIDVPGPELERLCSAAERAGVHVVIGVNERSATSVGSIFNTILTIDSDGELIGRHRKLVPTWAEKLTWANGDGSSLRVHDTAIGPLGVLACGENTNPLARFALLAQGELVHVANYISLPVAPPDYDMVEAIRMRAMAHSFEGKVFTVVACSTVGEDVIEQLGLDEQSRELLTRPRSAFSGVFGPGGKLLSEPLIDVEGIAYAEIDLGACIQPKQMHDITGHYNRFDVFRLTVDRRPQAPLTVQDLVCDPDADAGSADPAPAAAHIPDANPIGREHAFRSSTNKEQ
jgi:nitrilase